MVLSPRCCRGDSERESLKLFSSNGLMRLPKLEPVLYTERPPWDKAAG